MNKLMFSRTKIMKGYTNLKRVLHDNLFLIIGFYGLLAIGLLCALTPWLAQGSETIYPHLRLLLPAWNEQGDLNHILGIDEHGLDIFKHLLLAMHISMLISVFITGLVMLIGSVISTIAVFCKGSTDPILILFKTFTMIPPLLMMIIFAILSGNTLTNLMIVITLALLPRFIYNLYTMMNSELNKPYIMASRLDGLSTFAIMRHSVIPNTWLRYINECFHIFTTCLLALTTLTFLNFGVSTGHNELGAFMRDMVNIIQENQWAFIAPGLTILIVILLVNFFAYGLQHALSHRE